MLKFVLVALIAASLAEGSVEKSNNDVTKLAPELDRRVREALIEEPIWDADIIGPSFDVHSSTHHQRTVRKSIVEDAAHVVDSVIPSFDVIGDPIRRARSASRDTSKLTNFNGSPVFRPLIKSEIMETYKRQSLLDATLIREARSVQLPRKGSLMSETNTKPFIGYEIPARHRLERDIRIRDPDLEPDFRPLPIPLRPYIPTTRPFLPEPYGRN